MDQTTYTYKDGLESPRLYTRFLTMEDVPQWAEFFMDPKAIEFLGSHIKETYEESARIWIDRQLQRYKTGLYGHQALIDKQTGEFVGMTGVITQDVDGREQLEVGYHILSKYWGKGYAPEAARMFINYAFDELRRDSIISVIVAGNTKSERVAEKNGLWRDKQTEWKGYNVNIFRMNKDRWR